ncbi:E3 ubiquitin- ligase Topors [Olea europaea subsp. europaea]|uniref:RING-type E3 ubiquitin transferase n=1 Tax=Olea europaea subsp. europaea TaxID=158383 RepID=A0A8S0U2D4_OLEEU|nr:E3 ubiquitin- ligase Topors [Olea europaea subsp. europaea]
MTVSSNIEMFGAILKVWDRSAIALKGWNQMCNFLVNLLLLRLSRLSAQLKLEYNKNPPSRLLTQSRLMDSHGRSFSKRIAESVVGKSCPICLRHVEIRDAAVVIPCMHTYCTLCIRRWSDLKRKCPLCNTDFDSWFYKINLSSRKFKKENLLPSGEDKMVNLTFRDDYAFRRRRTQFFQQRLITRSREESRNARSRVRPLPRQRTFGHEGHEHPRIIAERVKQWRASIYEHRLQAVPLSSKTFLVQKMEGHNGIKQIILKKIEPWIQRELQAVLGDPDPTIIVHVATSIFFSRHEKKHKGFPEQVGSEDDFLAPLRPFLHEQTDMFWHELRCFAESSFSMETYDTLVEYKALD